MVLSVTQVSVGRTYAGLPVEDRQRQRRERFLESGLTVFARDGYSNSSVGAICRGAGLSSRQFYEEFAGREALLIDLFDAIESDSRKAVAIAIAASANDGVTRMIEAGTRAYIRSIGTDPRRAKVAIVEAVGASPRVEQYRVQQRKIWGGLIAHAAEDAATHGEIPPGDYEMRVSALLGAVNYVVYDWSMADPRPSLEDMIRVLTRTLIGAIGAH
jgi:AcrR family transcriptional regulator